MSITRTTGKNHISNSISMNINKLESIARQFLVEIGEDPSRPGLIDTPKRMAKMWLEVFRGYQESDKPKITVFDNNSDGINYNQIIIDKGSFFSHCEHHCAVFFGQYYFGYIPDKKIIGLSKVARLIDYFAAKMQVQERLGEDVINYLQELLEPKGLILILKAKHTCKIMRGVKKDGEMITSVVRGTFTKDSSAKQEFLNLINLK